MQSIISQELEMKFPPIVLLKSDTKPEGAFGPKTENGGCVMSFVAQTIGMKTLWQYIGSGLIGLLVGLL